MAEKNYYDILGVDKKASEADIKRLFEEKIHELLGQQYISKPSKTLADEVVKRMLDGLVNNDISETFLDLYYKWVDSATYRPSLEKYIQSYKINDTANPWNAHQDHCFLKLDLFALKQIAENVRDKSFVNDKLQKLKKRRKSLENALYSIEFLKRRGWDESKVITRAENGEHEYSIGDYRRAALMAGFKDFKYFNLVVVKTIDNVLNLKKDWEVAMVVQSQLNNYLLSADKEIGDKHISQNVLEKYILSYMSINRISDRNKVKIPDFTKITKKLWVMMCDPRDMKAPMTHDGYLKLWQLTDPKLNCDVVLLDEYQDTSPVINDIFMKQNCVRVAVGDESQTIFSYRGTRNILQDLKSNKEFYLTNSFRFGKKINIFNAFVLYQIVMLYFKLNNIWPF